jgi:CheY-like chemotaxis protein
MKRLLIADDDAGMRAALEARFQRRGWQVDVAVNGSEALTKFRQGLHPLVITDVRMPGRDGFELMREVQAAAPRAAVILLTAYGCVPDAVAAIRNGACDYGKIGEWFEKLGFATEQEVTAALALQWGCPVASSLEPDAITPAFRLPLAILETFHMLPLHHAPATNTLSIAFGERVDHAVLYAIEKMLHCRTQPCVAGRNSIAGRLDRMRHQPLAREFEFGPMHDAADMVRIASSYITKFGADEIQLDRFGPFLWLRLESRPSIMNLLFRLRIDLPHPRSTKLALPPLPYDRLPDYERVHAGE